MYLGLENRCPLCQRAARLHLFNSIDARVECGQCGNYKITRMLYDTIISPKSLSAETEGLLPYLSAHTRQATERGEEVSLDNGNWKEFALAHANTSVATKLTRFLEIIAARTKPGKSGEIDSVKDAPLLDASNPDEVVFFANTLHERELIDYAGKNFYSLKAKGWEAIQSASINGIPRRCFVAMSFDGSLQGAYDSGIFLAVKNDCKMDPIRVDREEYNEDICDKIIAEIRTCQFVVADFTMQRHGVYFEAGFAMGLGRPVIWACREDDFKNVHFDTRQYNHIVWKDPADLREKLTNRIKATIPGAV